MPVLLGHLLGAGGRRVASFWVVNTGAEQAWEIQVTGSLGELEEAEEIARKHLGLSKEEFEGFIYLSEDGPDAYWNAYDRDHYGYGTYDGLCEIRVALENLDLDIISVGLINYEEVQPREISSFEAEEWVENRAKREEKARKWAEAQAAKSES